MKRIITLFAFLLFGFMIQAQKVNIDVAVYQDTVKQCDTAGWLAMPISIINVSGASIPSGHSFTCSYKVNNGSFITETKTLTSAFPTGDTITFTFTAPYHFNQFAAYQCEYAIHYVNDYTPANDTVQFTRIFYSLPGYGNHSSDTSICAGNDATLMMELTGNGPWTIDFASGTDTMLDLPVLTPVISLTAPFDSSATFTLIEVSDVNGCSKLIGESITISVYYTLDIDLGSDTSLCAGSSILLDAGFPGASFDWWDNSTMQSVTIDTSSLDGGLGLQEIWVSAGQDGCFGSDTIVIDWVDCLGIDDATTTDFMIYPNPTSGVFSIEANQDFSGKLISIIDVHGRVIRRDSVLSNSSNLEMNISDLPDGFYYILISGNTGESRYKILKQ